MSDKFDEFLEEVESDIRQEKLQEIWQKYGKLIIGCVIGVFAFVAANTLWKNYQLKQNYITAEKFIGAQELIAQNKFKEAMDVLQSIVNSSSSKNYAILADLSKASLLQQAGEGQNINKAIEIYQSIIDNTHNDENFRNLAQVLQVNAQIQILPSSTPSSEFDNLITKLDSIINLKSAWTPFAQELKGFLLYKKNDFSAAAENFVVLAQDSKNPESMRTRAQIMAQTLAGKVSVTK